MLTSTDRRELVDRLHYTFISADYGEIDLLIAALKKKDNFSEICEEFFHGCKINSKGFIRPGGFFSNNEKSASLYYAMYEILGSAPETLPLKQQLSRIQLLRNDLNGDFRLPRGIFSLPKLEVLIVRGFMIRQMPESFENATSLRILDLSANQLSSFPKALLELKRLSALSLSHNAIETLPEDLQDLNQLRILSLSGNHIKSLPKNWQRLQHLRKLDLSMNRISKMPNDLLSLVELKDLKLSFNNLPASEEALWEKKIKDRSMNGST